MPKFKFSCKCGFAIVIEASDMEVAAQAFGRSHGCEILQNYMRMKILEIEAEIRRKFVEIKLIG